MNDFKIDNTSVEDFVKNKIDNFHESDNFIKICSIIYYTTVNIERNIFRNLGDSNRDLLYTDRIDENIKVYFSEFKANYNQEYVKDFYLRKLDTTEDLKITPEFKILYEDMNIEGRKLVDKYLEIICNSPYNEELHDMYLIRGFRSANHIKWYCYEIFYSMLIIHYITSNDCMSIENKSDFLNIVINYSGKAKKNQPRLITQGFLLATLISSDDLLYDEVCKKIESKFANFEFLIVVCLLSTRTECYGYFANLLTTNKINKNEKMFVLRFLKNYSYIVIEEFVKVIYENKLIKHKYIQDAYKILLVQNKSFKALNDVTFDEIDEYLYDCIVRKNISENFDSKNLERVLISTFCMFLTDSYTSYEYFINNIKELSDVQIKAFSKFVFATGLGKEESVINIFVKQTDLNVVKNFYNSFFKNRKLFTYNIFEDETEKYKTDLTNLFHKVENDINEFGINVIDETVLKYMLRLATLIDEEEFYYMGCKYLDNLKYCYELYNFNIIYVRTKVIELLNSKNKSNRLIAYLQLKDLNLSYTSTEISILKNFLNSKKKDTVKYVKDLLNYNTCNL